MSSDNSQQEIEGKQAEQTDQPASQQEVKPRRAPDALPPVLSWRTEEDREQVELEKRGREIRDELTDLDGKPIASMEDVERMGQERAEKKFTEEAKLKELTEELEPEITPYEIFFRGQAEKLHRTGKPKHINGIFSTKYYEVESETIDQDGNPEYPFTLTYRTEGWGKKKKFVPYAYRQSLRTKEQRAFPMMAVDFHDGKISSVVFTDSVRFGRKGFDPESFWESRQFYPQSIVRLLEPIFEASKAEATDFVSTQTYGSITLNIGPDDGYSIGLNNGYALNEYENTDNTLQFKLNTQTDVFEGEVYTANGQKILTLPLADFKDAIRELLHAIPAKPISLEEVSA
jgi:hypothetical protein